MTSHPKESLAREKLNRFGRQELKHQRHGKYEPDSIEIERATTEFLKSGGEIIKIKIKLDTKDQS